MKIIFTPPNLNIGETFSPSAEDQRHLVKVIRVKRGDLIEGSDGKVRYRCSVVRIDPKLQLQVTSAEPLKDRRKVSLAIAKIETARFASAVSAAAQMAVKEVCAFGCERASRSPLALDRLKRVAVESAKQVGCPFLPTLTELPEISDLAEKIRTGPAFLLDPYASQTLLESFPYELDDRGLMLIVGPVGDFTESEKQILQKAGAKPVQLCQEVLRSETAAVVALGVTATCIRTSRQE